MLGLYLLFFSVYFATGPGHFWSSDHVAVYLTTQSLVDDRDLAIKPIHDTVVGKDGRSYSTFGIGQPMLSTPLYLAGRLAERVGPAAVDSHGDYSGTLPIFFVSSFNQFVTPLTCLVFFLFCLRLGFSLRASLLTTLVFGFSTALWVGAHDYFQHPLETLFLLSSVYVVFAHREHLTARHALLSCALLAAGVLTRVNLLVAAPALFVYLLFKASRQRKAGGPASRLAQRLARFLTWLPARLSAPTIDAGLWFALPLAVIVALMMVMNELRFGDAFAFQPDAAAAGFSPTVLPVGLYGNLFSPGRSLFLYSPPAILGLALFPRLYRRYRDEAVLFGVIALSYLFLYSSFTHWHGDWSWGPRYLLPPVPFVMLPLAYVFENGRRPAVAAAALLAALGAGVQLLGVLVNVGDVYKDWLREGLDVYGEVLFRPGISAIPTHLKDLLHGRHVDLWLGWVSHDFSPGVFVLTLAFPLLTLAASVLLLRSAGASRR